MLSYDERIKNLPTPKPDETWTDDQRLALYESGQNIVVSAGAGSGKTAVLTQRILNKLLNRIHLRQLIVLTFTKNAATEMKERVRKCIIDNMEDKPCLKQELLDLDLAHIQTFDSFSENIVAQYHYLLGISKDIKPADNAYIKMLKGKLFDELLEQIIDEDCVQKILKKTTTENPQNFKKSFIGIYNKLETYVDTKKFLDEYEQKYLQIPINQLVENELKKYGNQLLEKLKSLVKSLENLSNSRCRDKGVELESKIKNAQSNDFYQTLYNVGQISYRSPSSSSKNCYDDEIASSKFSLIRKKFNQIKETFIKPSLEDYLKLYENSEEDIKTILFILKRYHEYYDNYLKTHNIYTFNTIAKLAIKLFEKNPSLCDEFKANYHEILVDEYQDTSLVQEKLLSLISNDNRFMVGDIKQSIYGFRNAELSIFKSKYDDFSKGIGGIAIDLKKNFRSRKEVLESINLIFTNLMSETFGGVNYLPNHALNYGLTGYDKCADRDYNMKIITYDKKELINLELSSEEYEAHLIAQDIRNKLNQGFNVYDKDKKTFRKGNFKDFVVLTRERKAYDKYRKVFEAYNIPVSYNDKEEYLNTDEVFFLINTLKLAYTYIDKDFNKYNYNHSLISFLRSFVIGESDQSISKLIIKGNTFRNTFPQYYEKILIVKNKLCTSSFEDVVNTICEQFKIYEKLYLIGDVEKGTNRINLFISKAKEMSLSNLSVKDFITFLEYLKNNNSDIEFESPTFNNNVLRVTTIHASKGLEYTHCYFPDLKRSLRGKDNGSLILFDETYGILPPVNDEGLVKSILVKTNSTHDIINSLSEYIRLFYVALTRAKESFTIITPILNHVIDDKNDAMLDVKSYYDLLSIIKEQLEDYIIDATLDLTMLNNITTSSEIKESNEVATYTELHFKHQSSVSTNASMRITDLIEEDTSGALQFGNELHEIFERVKIIDFKNLNKDEIKPNLLKIVSKFYQSDFIQSLNVINEYHEYQIYYANNGNKINGIIDLLIETDDEFIIIDYKTSDISKDGYIKQLKTYKEYIEMKTTKRVSTYLYSILKGEFKSIEC